MILLSWLVNAIALVIVTRLVPGFSIDSLATALIAAIVLGLANALIRPVLLILTFPITLLTLGIFTFVVNGLMLSLAAWAIPGFSIAGFGTAILAAFVLWMVSLVLNAIIPLKK